MMSGMFCKSGVVGCEPLREGTMSLAEESDLEDCEFCKIVARKEPAEVVYEATDVLAFFPLHPAALGHTLVIPKQHVRDIWELDKNLACTVIQSVVDVSHCLRSALHPDGLNVISSAGQAASQTIFHMHIHLVPRWDGDHIGDIWPPREPWAEEVAAEVAVRVRTACAGLAS